ncbi:hypothetical protein KP509_01G028800 [Ceratopteris richardii]|uniref:Uncharacterized protein n=1 Tax=Ceratopteris richardii TaxID=49495 RepID=A0A8T2VF11_CERRI|nr:hypothetical protein KP509_01G028800 [Ceratopteris richardii]
MPSCFSCFLEDGHADQEFIERSPAIRASVPERRALPNAGVSLNTSSLAEIVVAVDFGTTFSGFAYAKTSITPLEIHDNCAWPGAGRVGAMPYCKNQTSLFYLPNSTNDKTFELKEWGWSAFLAFEEAMANAVMMKAITTERSWNGSRAIGAASMNQQPGDPLNSADAAQGFYARNFKLYLAPQETNTVSSLPPLPEGLTPERLVVDYLRCLTDFIIQQLRASLNNNISKEDIQFCLTVPAIWDENAKQMMRRYAEKAGMVRGRHCPQGVSASPWPLYMILEPEAASVYCQDNGRLSLPIKKGERILVTDIGGGTIDLVVHEVVECHANIGPTKVKEVVPSYGSVGGGTFVDVSFFQLVEEKVGCFREYSRLVDPSLPLLLFQWWQKVKTDFDGSPHFHANYGLMNSGLKEAWKKHDQENGVNREDRHYWQLSFDSEDFKRIFDLEVQKVIDLIDKHIKGVKLLMVVGGFAASPYVKKSVMDRFHNIVEQIIIPVDPGRAICRGAVGLYTRRSFIQARIAKKTYGICAVRNALPDDPRHLLVVGDGGKMKCAKALAIFVRAQEEVKVGESKSEIFVPSHDGMRAMKFDLYSSLRSDPKYTTDMGVEWEGCFEIDISNGMILERKREIRVTMVFGDSLITVTASPVNFGNREHQESLVVSFERAIQV